MRINRRQFASTLTGALAVRSSLRAADPDWPQWRGPSRNGLSQETGLLGTWPSGGPKEVWSIKELGSGYGCLALAGPRIYVQGGKGRESVVMALNRADGKPVWQTALGQKLNQDRGEGPRGTPTVDQDRLYVLSEAGDLACLKTRDGSVVWKRNILQDFNGNNPHWLISESPLVDGGNVIVTPGGPGASMVALDKMTGKNVWTTKDLSDRAGYASAIIATIGGVRSYLNLNGEAGVGVRASDGKLLFRYEKAANRTANCTTPVFHANQVFYTSAYGTGGGLVGLASQGDGVKADEVYFTKEMQNHHGGVVLVGEYLYGFSNAILTCLEWQTGKVMWKDRSVGKGAVTYADGKLYLLGERNTMGLAQATPEGYKEFGRFDIPDQGFPSWAHPVVCGGRLYIRNQASLACYDIKA